MTALYAPGAFTVSLRAGAVPLSVSDRSPPRDGAHTPSTLRITSQVCCMSCSYLQGSLPYGPRAPMQQDVCFRPHILNTASASNAADGPAAHGSCRKGGKKKCLVARICGWKSQHRARHPGVSVRG